MKYFFDNCLSYRYANMLAALNVEAVSLRDFLPENTPDVEVFAQLKEKEYVFVTTDDKQKTRDREALAIKEAQITAIWFGPFWKNMSFWDGAKWIITRWPTIDGYVRGVAVGTCAEVKQNGTSRPFQL